MLPVADAAAAARPGLEAGVERLRVERIAMAMRELGGRRAAWLRGLDVRDLRLRHAHAFGGDLLRAVDRLRAGPRLLATPRPPRRARACPASPPRAPPSTGANRVSGPSRLRDNTAFERSWPT